MTVHLHSCEPGASPAPSGPDAALSQALADLSTPVDLTAGSVLHRAGLAADHVYLLESAMVATTLALRDGETAGVGLASGGDLVGLEAVFHHEPSQTTATVLIGGAAQRYSAQALSRRTSQAPGLAHAFAARLARRNVALEGEIACCIHHSVEQRLARLIQQMSNRLNTGALQITQEQLADLLGVQRTTVSALAGRLKSAGVVNYLRGMVRISDPARLAAISCGCPG